MHLSAKFAFLLASISVSIASPIYDGVVIDKDSSPLLSSSSSPGHEIPNSYIVVFKKHVDDASAIEHHNWVADIHESSLAALQKRSQLPLVRTGDSESVLNVDSLTGLRHTYNISGGFLGYSGAFDHTVIDEIQKHPDVEYVEKDSKVFALEDPVTQHSAPWGLARISHRKKLELKMSNEYIYQPSGGEGVDVYVIDTGIYIDHVDFGGRAHWGKTIPKGDEDRDGNGHGTHCSGTVAGTKYGVAKKAEVYAVKVLRSDGSGTLSDVVKGVEWAAESHVKKAAKGDKKFKGSAANMSLGGGESRALDLAVNSAVGVGLHFAVAAGNDYDDACYYSPASAESAVTVGASTLADERADFSNIGKCVDIFAPGVDIESTWIDYKDAINTISGTSMASPHIAGLLAYFISLQPKSDSSFSVGQLSPEELKKYIVANGSKGKLVGVPSGTANIVAYNGGGSANLNGERGERGQHW